MNLPEDAAKYDANRRFNLTLTAVVAQVGCVTPLLILGGLFLGLWFDRLFKTQPLFTIIFIVVSMPISVLALFWIVRAATQRLKPENHPNPAEGGR